MSKAIKVLILATATIWFLIGILFGMQLIKQTGIKSNEPIKAEVETVYVNGKLINTTYIYKK